MPTLAPRLVRAVAEATQPYGPFLQGQALHALEEYFADPSKTESVYYALLNRASAEPFSAAVIDNCVNVMKRYLPRYPASQDVLLQIREFCRQATDNKGGMSPDLKKALLYLQTLAENIANGKQPGLFVKGKPGMPTHSRTESSPPLFFRRASNNSRENFHRTNSTPEQRVELPGGGHRSDTGGASLGGNDFIAEGSVAASLWGPEDAETSDSGRAIIADVLAWRWGWLPGEEADADSITSLPSHLRDLDRFQLSVARDEDQAALPSVSNAAEIEDEISIIRHVQRQQVQQASYTGPAENTRPRLRDNRPRLLFQHRPYSEQERLDLSQREVAAVVEAVCGVHDEPSIWGDHDMADGRTRDGGSARSGEQPNSICASILIKMLLDLWLQTEAADSFPLALILLHRALDSAKAAVRARAFDLAYNLSLHAELLYPLRSAPYDIHPQGGEGPGTQPNANGDAAESPAGPSSRADPAEQSGKEKTETSQSVKREQFRRWLRLLLFQLLLLITQRKEEREDVWLAALGCLLHLTTKGGQPQRSALAPLPPRVLAALLRCCTRFRWSEQIHCHLLRMATNLLYAPGGVSHEADDPAQGGRRISRSGEEGFLMELKEERLADFGGVAEVVAQLKVAPSREACRNLLSVLLDYVVPKKMEVQEAQAAEDVVLELTADLKALGKLLEAANVAELLRGAFQCAWPGFAAHFTAALLGPGQDGAVDGRRRPSPVLTQSVMSRLEALACQESVSFPPPGLVTVVQQSMDCVQGSVDDSDAASAPQFGELDSVWLCLADHLISTNEWASRLGASWLLSLLVAAAERHLSSGIGRGSLSRNGGVALLPQLPDSVPSLKGPHGIPDQPQLAALIRHFLLQAVPGVNATIRFVDVVRRLLQYIKLRCALPSYSVPTSPSPPGSASRPVAIFAPMGSADLGTGLQQGSGETFLSDEDATPRPLGNGRTSLDESPGPRHSDPDWEDTGDVFAHCRAADLMLSTLFLAVEWLLDAPMTNRSEACLEAGVMLLELVSTRRSKSRGSAPTEPLLHPGEGIANTYDRSAAPAEASADGILAANLAGSAVWAFLSGAAAVPREVLHMVSPVLLARLFQHLGTGASLLPPNAVGSQRAAWGRDVRAALLLVLIARCSLDTAALQQAGGEGVFVDLLSDSDPRVRFHAATFLQQRLRTARPEVYRRALRQLMQQAQQHDDDKLLRNAHLQLSTMLEMRLVDFSV